MAIGRRSRGRRLLSPLAPKKGDDFESGFESDALRLPFGQKTRTALNSPFPQVPRSLQQAKQEWSGKNRDRLEADSIPFLPEALVYASTIGAARNEAIGASTPLRLPRSDGPISRDLACDRTSSQIIKSALFSRPIPLGGECLL